MGKGNSVLYIISSGQKTNRYIYIYINHKKKGLHGKGNKSKTVVDSIM